VGRRAEGKLDMTIAYHVGENLYLNITNRCTARCDFCLRRKNSGYGDAESLWLSHEPEADEVMADAQKKEWTSASEVVFCGFGEPTMRLEVMLEVAREMKKQKPDVKLRLNTNGHGSMFAGRDITPDLVVFDAISISLNYIDEEQYELHCRPMFGIESFNGIIDFVNNLKTRGPKVTITVTSLLHEDEIELARKFAGESGVEFRVRQIAQ
jgi:TatD family-associated radical SAM protein